MARDYIRPELSVEDIEEFQSGKCIMINPQEKDIATALKTVEKRCRKNKLPLPIAKAAWREVYYGPSSIAAAGVWNCPKNSSYGTQGTIVEVIRLTEGLVGL